MRELGAAGSPLRGGLPASLARDQSKSPELDADALATAPWLGEAQGLLQPESGRIQTYSRGLLRALDAIDRHAPLGLPWCGLFVAHCLRTALPELDPPAFYPRAQPWLRWGHEVTPQLGAIMVFWRLHPNTPFGHVSFYWAEDEEAFHVIGGNQSDRILIQRRPKDRLLGARWPDGFPHSDRRRHAPPDAAEPFG